MAVRLHSEITTLHPKCMFMQKTVHTHAWKPNVISELKDIRVEGVYNSIWLTLCAMVSASDLFKKVNISCLHLKIKILLIK